jgi:Divergent InlB B-repeat domain
MLRFAWFSVLVAMMSGVAGCPGPSGTDSGVPPDDAPSSDAPAADAGDAGLDASSDTGLPDAGTADAPTDASLTVTLSGAGTGTVTSAPTGIDCGATCTGTFAIGTSVVLTAAAETGSTFGGWSGACTGTSLTCTVTLSAATTVGAAFEVRRETLTVTSAGTGDGVVSSTPAGIDCGSDCAADFDFGTVVTLSAAPAPGSTFAGWSGACTGTADCMVTVESAVDVTATFTLQVLSLSVTRAGTGAGSVTSAPAGITCGATCNADFDYGTLVTLTATASSGSTFSGWSGGGCTGVGSCVVTLTAATSVTATFTLDRHDLAVSKLGSGAGTITSAPAGINCGTTCTAAFDHGTPVTLTAAAAPGSTFVGWSGAGCSGTGTCSITMNAAESVSALFSLQSFTLSVGQSGGGTGTITSSVGGINCGASCATLLDFGTVVTLTATPGVSSTFAGWGGACTGLGTCTLTIGAATSVTAAFDLRPIALTVTRAGTGTGTVTSSPAGINCGATCMASFDYGNPVVLTAAPGAGSTFTGWTGGGCSGTGTCVVSPTAATTVTATFTASIFNLTVTRAGTGTGVVTSSPAGINCGATCTAPFVAPTLVTLIAAPALGSTFTGWSGGGCSGTGTCSVAMTSAQSVTATFTLTMVTITIAKTGPLAASASVTSSPPGITCGATCTGSFAPGTVVTLTQTPGGSVFNGWSGAGCTGTGDCTFTVGAATTVTAAYRGVRVAISAGAASCIRPGAGARLTTLLAARGHSAVFATGAELDTAPEINVYDVVVTAGPGAPCGAPEASAYDSVIDAFIRTTGRGVVVTGWFLYADFGAPNLVADLPVTLAPNYLIGPQTVTPVAGHPITSGVGSFSTLQWLPYGGGTRPGATSLLSVGGTSVAAAWTVGSGRSVFLGPMFMESYADYDNENLLDGTQAAPIELMLRSIEWAARAR